LEHPNASDLPFSTVLTNVLLAITSIPSPQVLVLLRQKALEGSTSAMIALERALRIGGEDEASGRGRFHRVSGSEREEDEG
jgi:hypothetical protein